MTDLATLLHGPLYGPLYALIVKLHIAAGVLALITFWIAGLARKARHGLHVKAGRVYLIAMRGILVTAAPMALAAFIDGKTAKGVFLSYLVVLVATTVYTAPRAVRLKQDFDAYRRGGYRLFAVLLPVTAGLSMTYGIVQSNLLLAGFAVVGLVLGRGMWRQMRTTTPDAGWWLKEHYGAMIGNGVGTHIAFLAIGLSRVLPKDLANAAQMLAWFGPLAVAVVVNVVLNRRHRQRFGQRRRAMPAPVTA